MNEIQKTNTSVQVFNNSSFGEIRTSWISEEPYFCLVDLCRILDLDNVSRVRSRLDERGLLLVPTLTAGGVQEMTYANEPNFYKCVFQSRKEEARAFQDWVYYKVLPEIRKTGGYGKQMSKSEMRLMVFMDMQSEINRQSNVIKKQGKRITALLSQLESEKEAKRERLAIASETRDENVKRWLSESGIKGVFPLSSLSVNYSSFCEKYGILYDGKKRLSSALRNLGFNDVRKAKGVYFII